MKTGLVLSGGGARGAYQVGVLKAMADIHPKSATNPFNIITGTSSGAINAVGLAASANNFRLGVKKVERIWSKLIINQVVKVNAIDLLSNSTKLLAAFINPKLTKNQSLGLLNNMPLRQLLTENIKYENIHRRIDSGYLDAVSVSATSYASGKSVSFFESHEGLKCWRRNKRIGVRAKIGVEHLLGSTALPGIFPAEKIGRQYFGDGSLRQLAPLSSALRLGSERIVVVGVRGTSNAKLSARRDNPPSMAQTFGHIFSSAFIDAMDNDINNLSQINEMIGVLKNEAPHFNPEGVKPIDLLVIEPSVDFDNIAAEHLYDLPLTFRRILKGLGASKEGGGNLASYLMFESAFCKRLIDYGYTDTMSQKNQIIDFFGLR
jgi:NTE family protein